MDPVTIFAGVTILAKTVERMVTRRAQLRRAKELGLEGGTIDSVPFACTREQLKELSKLDHLPEEYISAGRYIMNGGEHDG